jgi:hypothetical protein
MHLIRMIDYDSPSMATCTWGDKEMFSCCSIVSTLHNNANAEVETDSNWSLIKLAQADGCDIFNPDSNIKIAKVELIK